MFERLKDASEETVHFVLDGNPCTARKGDTVAAALLKARMVAFRRSPVSDEPRAPYCMMGVCFECLVNINGLGSCQACLTPIAEGMVIRTGQGRRVITAESIQS